MKFLHPIIAVALTLAPAASFSGEKANEPNTVTIDNFSFSPQTLVVRAGTQVTWINRDDIPHTVVSVDNKFKSPPLDTDERFSFTFVAPGTNAYFCSIHAHMTGKIVVVEAAPR